MKGMPEIIADTGPIVAIPTVDDHLKSFWDILKGYPGTVEDYLGYMPDSCERFSAEYKRRTRDSVTLFFEGIITGFGFLEHITEGHSAYGVVVKRAGYPKGLQSIRLIVSVIRKEIFPCWFEKWHLEKLCGIVRENNIRALRFDMALGFRQDGILRHHEKVNGVWTDAILVSLLREEL